MRCIVKDCKNHEHEGKFIGSLCFPCYTYITKGEGKYSQAFRNAQRTWVGLTDKDWNRSKHNYDFQKGADWAESILKEKNT